MSLTHCYGCQELKKDCTCKCDDCGELKKECICGGVKKTKEEKRLPEHQPFAKNNDGYVEASEEIREQIKELAGKGKQRKQERDVDYQNSDGWKKLEEREKERKENET